MNKFKPFSQYVEERDQYFHEENNLPDGKLRNGLADPDPGELKQPHKVNSKDLDLAKQAVQIIMRRSTKWHRNMYNFLRKCAEKIPEVGHLVDNMEKPKDYEKIFGSKIGENDDEPNSLVPNSSDQSSFSPNN